MDELNDELANHIRQSEKRMRMVLRIAIRHLGLRSKGHRQAEVLALASIGLSDVQIASALHSSPETIGTHWQRVLHRLQARTRTEAVAILLERELASRAPRPVEE